MVKPRDNAGPTEQNVPMTGGRSNSQDLASETRMSQAERVCAEPQLTHSSDNKGVRSRWYRGGGPIADRWTRLLRGSLLPLQQEGAHADQRTGREQS